MSTTLPKTAFPVASRPVASLGPSSAAGLTSVAVIDPVPATSAATNRVADYLAICKPKISVMVLVTVAAGFALGGDGSFAIPGLMATLLGVGLVAIGSGAFNQWYERDTDAVMRRTANRPLPAGRLPATEVLLVGLLAAAIGTAVLMTQVNGLTAVLTLATFLMYTLAYTPMKRLSGMATTVGAFPGAMPPLLGYVATGSKLDLGAFVLFAILFLWQFPHFLAIAWLNQDDYNRAGLKMLPAISHRRGVVGLIATVYAIALLGVSFLPEWVGMAGARYSMVAMVLGVGYVAASVAFALFEDRLTARRLLWTSLVYLPALWIALVWDHWLGLWI